MSTKKNPPKNKNDGRKKGLEVEVVDQLKIPEVRYAAEIMVPQSKGNKETSSYPKEMLLVHPDISSILKESEDLEQDEEHDEYFDHPLHSTAVDADWNEVLEKAELQKKKSTKDVPQIPSVSKGTHKSKSQSSVTSKRKTRKSVTDHATQKDTTRKRTQTPHRAESQVREFPPCSNIKDYPEKMALEDLPGQDSDNHSSQGVAHTLQEPAKSNKSGRKRRKSGGSPKKKADKSRGRKRNNSIPKESATSGRNKPASLKIWCPEGLPRSARDQNELDVVLFEFEDIVTDYKQTVDSDVCKKLTDRFFSSFKEQLTESTAYKCRKFKTIVPLPRSGRPAKISPRTNQQINQEVTKNPRVTSKDLQATIALTNVSVHDTTIRKRPNKNGVHGRIARRKSLLSKKNIAGRLKFARAHR
ncbi:centromere protein U isoform X5 [Ascaphus truei]|uniref:centromere protein U isoform X5 n=1 Tax=Ascaphus truei TaxID=8439 RepID=UPI003F59BD54